MKCLVTGAYGFIGSEVVAALLREGMTVIGCGRDFELARRMNPAVAWIACDFNTDVKPAHWLPHLAGIDVAGLYVDPRDLLADDRQADVRSRKSSAPRSQGEARFFHRLET